VWQDQFDSANKGCYGENQMSGIKKADGEKRTYVSIEDFVRAYEDPKNQTIADVANKLGAKPAVIKIRASKLREKGVDLRRFKRGNQNIVEKANEILALIREGK
jgi:hypothetical protein